MKPVFAIVLLFALLILVLGLVFQKEGAVSLLRSLEQDMPSDLLSSARVTAASIQLPLRGPLAPQIVSDTWLNSAPLSPGDLRGKVTVIEFWTFDCINCRNTIPQVRGWYEKYHEKGLLVIGVHSPELPFEYDVSNVKRAIQDLKIQYPVALDNNFNAWNAFHVWAWPTVFILDKQGAIRFTHVGEGAYAEAEQAIARLLNE